MLGEALADELDDDELLPETDVDCEDDAEGSLLCDTLGEGELVPVTDTELDDVDDLEFEDVDVPVDEILVDAVKLLSGELVPDKLTEGDPLCDADIDEVVVVVAESELAAEGDTDVEDERLLVIDCVPVVLTVPVREVEILTEGDPLEEDSADCEGEPVLDLDVDTDCVLVGALVPDLEELTDRVAEVDGGGFVIVAVTEDDNEDLADFVLDPEGEVVTVPERLLVGDLVLVPEPLFEREVEIVRDPVEDTDELREARTVTDILELPVDDTDAEGLLVDETDTLTVIDALADDVCVVELVVVFETRVETDPLRVLRAVIDAVELAELVRETVFVADNDAEGEVVLELDDVLETVAVPEPLLDTDDDAEVVLDAIDVRERCDERELVRVDVLLPDCEGAADEERVAVEVLELDVVAVDERLLDVVRVLVDVPDDERVRKGVLVCFPVAVPVRVEVILRDDDALAV